MNKKKSKRGGGTSPKKKKKRKRRRKLFRFPFSTQLIAFIKLTSKQIVLISWTWWIRRILGLKIEPVIMGTDPALKSLSSPRKGGVNSPGLGTRNLLSTYSHKMRYLFPKKTHFIRILLKINNIFFLLNPWEIIKNKIFKKLIYMYSISIYIFFVPASPFIYFFPFFFLSSSGFTWEKLFSISFL